METLCHLAPTVIDVADSPPARPDSPELSPELTQALLTSLRRWTVDASVPLAHTLLEEAGDAALEAYDAMALANPAAPELLEDRYLSPVPDMDELRGLGEGTLGRAFAQHIDANGLDVDKLRESAFIDAHAKRGEDQGYLAERGFQLHDLFHVLTGYDTSPLGEVKVVCFTAAQIAAPYPVMIMTTRPLQMALYEPNLLPFVMDAVTEGWQRGRVADQLIGVRWEDHWGEPLEELRTAHGL